MDLPPLQMPDRATPPPQTEARLRAAAQALEASFLAQMLETAGLGDVPDAFGGGAGESQFASFLRQAQAEEMAARGGIGLSKAIFDSLVERTRD